MNIIIGQFYSKGPPCQGAKWESYVRYDVRTTDDPKKIPCHNGTDGGWYDEGRNHRVVDGQITRDTDAHDWFVEVNTLDDVVALLIQHPSWSLRAPDHTSDFVRLNTGDE